MAKINRKNFILSLASSAAGIFLTSCLSRLGIVTSATAAGTTSSAPTESSSTS